MRLDMIANLGDELRFGRIIGIVYAPVKPTKMEVISARPAPSTRGRKLRISCRDIIPELTNLASIYYVDVCLSHDGGGTVRRCLARTRSHAADR